MLIYIDIGHGKGATGKYDPGAVGIGGLRENDVVKDVGDRLGHLLRVKGFFTVGIALNAAVDGESRTEAANNANTARADLFISLHCNAFADPSANGFEVLWGKAKGKALAQQITGRVMAEVNGGASKWLKTAVALRDRGLQYRPGLTVLARTKMPAVLVELAFITNPRENALLRDKIFKQAMAQAVANGIHAYLKSVKQ